jgi:hypothetical protein
MLPTVLSRCIEFTFRPEDDDLRLSPELDKKFRETLLDVLKTKNFSQLSSTLVEKDEALIFLQFLQSVIYQCLLAKESGKTTDSVFCSLSPHELTMKFDSIVTLEGQLRSNANYGLMIESLMRQQFSGV